MIIDLTKLITNLEDELAVDVEVGDSFLDRLVDSDIRALQHVMFHGMIHRICDIYQLEGTLSGTMVLADDVTLEDVDYKFQTNVSEEFSDSLVDEDNNLEIIQNRLDISEFLWQNIVMEIPSKVCGHGDIHSLKGNGWRFVTEEELEGEKVSPFSELQNMFENVEKE